MNRKPDARGLKTWSLSSVKKEWEAMVVVAFTENDAKQLYIDAGGTPHGIDGEFRNHSGLGGNHFHARVPNLSRGVYFGDRMWNSVMFVEPQTRPIIDPVPAEALAAAAAQPMPPDYGKLRTGFQKGIKVDVWTYESPFADRAHADRMTADVRLEPRSGRRGGGGDKGLIFTASSKCFPEDLESPNVETLFAKVQEAFRTYDLTQRGVVWEDWLEVVIQPEREPDDEDRGKRGEVSYGFTLGYKVIPRGVDPRDPKVVYTREGWYSSAVRFPLPKAAGVPDRDPKTGKMAKEDGEIGRDYFHAREQRYQYAYIPATPENRAALDAVIAKLVELKVRLAAVLDQKVIRQQLAGIATGLLTFKGDEEVGHGG